MFPGYREAKDHSERVLIEAEKFRAAMADPPGEHSIKNVPVGQEISDDDFFHLTCQVDPNLVVKIERGKFVDLEKLLPKRKRKQQGMDNRLEWVQDKAGTFLVPALDRENKINNVRRWDQAF